MSEAFFSGDAVVSIGAASAAASACTTFTTYITNFKVSGGEADTEVINVFGNANIFKRSPRGEYEASFDFIMRGDSGTLFEQLVGSSSLDSSLATAVDMSTLPQETVVYVQLLNEDGDTYKSYGFNNALCTYYEGELGADEHATGSVTFKIPAKTETGTSNVKAILGQASGLTW